MEVDESMAPAAQFAELLQVYGHSLRGWLIRLETYVVCIDCDDGGGYGWRRGGTIYLVSLVPINLVSLMIPISSQRC